jgi:flagellar biosynthesis protein FlhG
MTEKTKQTSSQTGSPTKTGGSKLVRAKNVIAIASGKGGVGKTWFSVSLAHALSKAGKRVLLFDGDLGLANVDVQLGLMPKRDLSDVIHGRLMMDRVVQTYEDGGFDIIAGRSGSASLSALPSQRLTLLREQLMTIAKDYDAVLIDLGAGVDRTVRMLSSTSSTTLLVSTDEPTSLTDAYAFIKLCHAAGLARAIQIVVNMAQTNTEGQKTYNTLLKACENFLKIRPPMAGLIRRDNKVRDAIRAQTPILTRSPNTEAAQDIEAIAQVVIQRLEKLTTAAKTA